jgi:hypothetical protein
MSESNSEKLFVARVRQALEQSAKDLDARTTFRLAGARRRALEHARRSAKTVRAARLSPLAGLAAVAALAVFLLVSPSTLRQPQVYSGIEDVDILATSEAPDFYAELDFFTWLADQVEPAG